MISPTFRTVQMTEHTQTHNFAPIGQLVIDPWNFEYCAKQQSLSVSKKNVSRPVRVQNPSKIILMCCPAILPLHAKAKNLSSPPYTRTGDLYLAIYTRLNCCWRRPSRHIHRENRCKLTMETVSEPDSMMFQDQTECGVRYLSLWYGCSSVAMHCRVTILWNGDDISPYFTM